MPKVLNIDRFSAQHTELKENEVMISISEEHEEGYAPLHFIQHNSEKCLSLKFSDVTGEVTVKQHKYMPPRKEDIYKILDFISKNLGKDFIIHCHAGVSRSGAIAYFLHEAYNYDVHPHFWYLSEPNPYIFGKLLLEHRSRSEKN